MRYLVPSIHCLTAFEAVARLRSLTKASEELHVSTSAVGHRLRQLQDGIGFKLFTGPSGEYTMSARGSEYLEVVKSSLASLNHYPISASRSSSTNTLRIASPPSFARQILVSRLPEFLRTHPKLNVALQLSVPIVGLKADDADVEIRFGDGIYEGLETFLLSHESVFPVCSPAYLARHGKLENPLDLAHAVLLRSALEPWRPWLSAAGLDWPEPKADVDYVDMGLLLEASINGQGIALARQKMVEQYLAAGTLVRLFDLSAPSTYGFYLTASSASVKRQEVFDFIVWLQEVMK
ncbi:LysR family transcriptional regulator [Pseudomonas sp. RIT-PI-q]|uniref:LysR substrate-binding domain-containing protein n=1 Tax=Pseudomonas sp. RIT-PI-q TaxID=1690247 RepID=UPI0006CD16DC|nr:LysR family transcriptional regulator [Pseudomonas sp. RIT-PI-q]